MTPRFSVIMPVYNVEHYLARGVDSVLRQSCQDFELILVDDGSTDGSPALCDELARQHNCIRVIHKPNGGLADARNTGIDNAVGEYVLMPDSDDWIEPDTLSVVEEALSGGEVDMVRYDLMRHDGKDTAYVTGLPAGLYKAADRDKLLDMALLRPNQFWLSACTHAYRRAFLNRCALRFVSEREVFSEDYLFNLSALMVAESLYNTGRVLYHYECRAGSLTQTKRKPRVLERNTSLYHHVAAYAKAHGGDDALARKINTYYIYKLVYHRCIIPAYREADGRAVVRTILKNPDVRSASRHMTMVYMSPKTKLKMLCIRYGCEPFFNHLLNH